jgi:hypothetical protein
MHKNAIKIMLDTNIFDELYNNEPIQHKFNLHIRSGRFKFYITAIQKAEIRKNFKLEDKAKREWSLQFYNSAEVIPTLFSFDIEGAGLDEGRFATAEEIEQYRRIKPNSSPKNYHEDRNIGIIANANVDIFVTNNKKDYPKAVLSNLKVLSWDEFVHFMEGLYRA